MPDRLSWATSTLLKHFYNRTTRDDTIRQRHRAGELTTGLAREYGLSPARISQILHGHDDTSDDQFKGLQT